MTAIKVGIVEDEMIVAQGISLSLRSLGYTPSLPATSYAEALDMIANEKPDILLVDIKLKGHKDGIDLARKVIEQYKIPFIFLTANADTETVQRAKELVPHTYLVKPFNKEQLYTAIEISLGNFSQRSNAIQKNQLGDNQIKDSIFIKNGYSFQKVKTDDILYLESKNMYVTIHTSANKFLVRSSIQNYMELIGAPYFIRIHKGFVVNTNHIDTLNYDKLTVNGVEIPIGRTYRDALLAFLKMR